MNVFFASIIYTLRAVGSTTKAGSGANGGRICKIAEAQVRLSVCVKMECDDVANRWLQAGLES